MPVMGGAVSQRHAKPSCFDRVKTGFMMGACMGMASGLIFSGFTCLRFGLRGRELLRTVGKGMAQHAGTFGVFVSVGTVISLHAVLLDEAI